jgi:PadR family transcriptional regulator PadR
MWRGGRRLVAIPGIGPITATATVAAIGNGPLQERRGFSAWLGVAARPDTPTEVILVIDTVNLSAEQAVRHFMVVLPRQARILLTKNLIPVYSMPTVNRPMTETTSRDLFPGALEMMILGSLRRQPSHGYALVQHIQQLSKNLLQVEEGSLYPALQRLLKAKLVKAEWGVSSTNRRIRTYQITAAGLRHLDEQISSFERMFEGIALVLNPTRARR